MPNEHQLTLLSMQRTFIAHWFVAEKFKARKRQYRRIGGGIGAVH